MGLYRAFSKFLAFISVMVLTRCIRSLPKRNSNFVVRVQIYLGIMFCSYSKIRAVRSWTDSLLSPIIFSQVQSRTASFGDLPIYELFKV